MYQISSNIIWKYGELKGVINGEFKTIPKPINPYGFIINNLKGQNILDEECSNNIIIDFEETELLTCDTRERVLRFEVMKNSDLRELNKKYGVSTFYETDIDYIRRLYIDNIFTANFENTVVYFDIETQDDKGFPEIERAGEFAIASISVFNQNGESQFFLGREDGKLDIEKEVEMFKKFTDYIVENKKTTLVGWNVNFDISHLRGRAKYLKEQYGMNEEIVDILDICGTIDLLEEYRNVIKGVVGGYSLRNIAKHENLTAQKLNEDDKRIWQMSDEELEMYNTEDVRILYELEKKYNNSFTETRIGISSFLNLPVYKRSFSNRLNEKYIDLNGCNTVSMGDTLVINRMRELGHVAVNNPRLPKEDYIGALVVEPTVGLFNAVISLDIDHMYPSLVIHNNIDLEWYSGEILPHIAKNLLELRYKYKASKEKIKEVAVKIVANGVCYGLLGTNNFRGYNTQMASSITMAGRELGIKIGKLGTDDLGLLELYGDSVLGDTKIWIKENGEVIEKDIEDLFLECNKRGLYGKEYYFPSKKIETLTLTQNGEMKWKEMKYVMRHKTDKNIFRINLNNSQYVDVTEDHSIAKYIRNKDRKTKDLYDFEKPENLKSLMLYLQSIKREKIISRNYPKEVYEFMGFFIGDGNSWKKNNNYYRYDMSIGSEAMEEVLSKLVKPLIDKGWIKSYGIRKNGHDIHIYGGKMQHLISEIYESGKKDIPNWLMDEKDENICAFIRGLFSADGTVLNSSRKSPIVRLTSVNEEWMKKVQRLCWFVGIATKYFSETKPNKYKDKISTTYSKHLVIMSNSMNRFIDNVNFIIDKKSNRLKRPNRMLKYTGEFELTGNTSIECIGKTDDYVYDIEVEDTHVFFANGVLVHNTDSRFFSIEPLLSDNNTIEEIAEVSNTLVDYFNENITPYSLKLEKCFKKMLFMGNDNGDVVKKRYIGSTYDGKIIFTGIELKRGDSTPLLKKTMKRIIDMIFLEDANKMDVYKYMTQIKNEVYDKQHDEELIITKRKSKSVSEYKVKTPIVKAIEKAKQMNKNFEGDDISWVIVGSKRNPDIYPITNISDLKEVRINYDIMFNDYVQKPCERIINSVWIPEKPKYADLTSYM